MDINTKDLFQLSLIPRPSACTENLGMRLVPALLWNSRDINSCNPRAKCGVGLSYNKGSLTDSESCWQCRVEVTPVTELPVS